MSYASPITSTRFFALVRHLVKHIGSANAAAATLGFATSYVAKIVRGEEGVYVREQSVMRAEARLRLPPGLLAEVRAELAGG